MSPGTTPRGRAALAVLTVAVVVLAPGLGNGFAYDDVPLLVEDTRLHEWGTFLARLADSWWPTGLFRPVSLAALGLQWLVSDGAPLLFRVVSTALYAATCLGVFRLASLGGAGLAGAVLGGLLFAVHPVHVEATANIVGQAELLCALFTLGAVLLYLHGRRWGGAPSPLAAGSITALAVLAANAKETGYLVPGLLLGAEALLVADRRSWRERLVTVRPLALLLTAAVLASLLVRFRVLGALGGETPHPSLAGLSLGERAVAMVAVIPEWARLLLWPSHLQAEYGPPGLLPATTPGWPHLGGLLLLSATAAGIWMARHRAPLIAFGLVWLVATLLPVANLLTPTGVLLAERTLFLPSVGIALAVAGLVDLLGARVQGASGLRRVLGTGVAALIILGGIHGARRQPVWRDSLTLLSQTVEDAPDSYRARFMLGRELARLGRGDEAERRYREAIALWQGEPRPYEELGQLLRARGDCAGAIPVLEGGVRADSTSDVARSRLIECLIVERRWDAAEREIERGLAQGVESYRLAARRVKSGRVPPGNL